MMRALALTQRSIVGLARTAADSEQMKVWSWAMAAGMLKMAIGKPLIPWPRGIVSVGALKERATGL
jgi:hypothetical protein